MEKFKATIRTKYAEGLLLMAAALFFAAYVNYAHAAASGQGQGNGNSNDDKIIVCHVPNGDVSKMHEVEISRSALEAHLAHGDEICGGAGGFLRLEN